MELTDAYLEGFIGGQLEVRRLDRHKVYRGQIKSAMVQGPDVVIMLEWCARLHKSGNGHDSWIRENDPTMVRHAIDTRVCSADQLADNILSLSVPGVPKTYTLYDARHPTNLRERSLVG